MSRWWLFGLLACRSTPTPTASTDVEADTDTDADSDTDTDADSDADVDAIPPVDTGPFGVASGEGSLVLRHVADEQRVELHGLFLPELPVVDAALCWPEAIGLCPAGLPLRGSDVAAPRWTPDPSVSIGVGPAVTVGGFSATRRADPTAGVHYTGRHSDAVWATNAPVDVALAGGQWAPFATSDALRLPPPVELLVPAPGEVVRLLPGERRQLEWVPSAGPHRLTLEVRGSEEPGSRDVRQVFVLEDDGEASIEVDALGLLPANQTVLLTLARTARADLTVLTEPLDVAARTESTVVAEHLPLHGLAPIATSTVCTVGPMLEDGSWYGFLDNAVDAHDPSTESCTRGPTPGRDASFQVELQPGERLTVRGRRLGGDASLYLVGSCADLRETCLAASDEAPLDGTEVLVYQHDGTTPQTFYLVVDSPLAGGGVFVLDVERDLPSPDPASDGCAGLDAMPSVSGLVTVDLGAAVDHLDAGATSCAYQATAGSDVLLPVHVPAGDVLHARADAPVALYALEDCVDERTCVAGAARFAPLAWTNTTSDPMDLALVVDQPSGSPPLGPVDLQVDVVTPIDTLATDCTSLAAPLATGVHDIRTQLTGSGLDLAAPGPSCTYANSAGPDGVLAVRLQPGERLDAHLDHAREGVLALLHTCAAPQSWATCADEPGADEHLSYENTSSNVEDLALWVDTWQPPNASLGPAAIELTVEIRAR